MKFKKITIQNIASIEEAEIDFTKGSIGKQPVFLIYGKTGSGKTTILDAICLALYNNAPRLKNSKAESYDDSDVSGSTSTNSPIVLVRRGTTSAKVEFEFEGNDGKAYLAKWEAEAYSRGMSKGKLKTTPKRFLQCTGEDVPLTKMDEINARVKDSCCVGLDYDQFCRTTLLAQGEFTKFLKSDDENKAAILEKLTGTEIYTKIGEEIADITSKKNDNLKVVESQLNRILVLSPDEVKQKQSRIEALEVETQILGKQMAETNVKLLWLQTERRLKTELNTHKQQLGNLTQQLNSQQQIQQRNTLDSWKRTDVIRQKTKDLEDTNRQQAQLDEKEEKLKTHFLSLTGSRLGLQANMTHINDKITETSHTLNSYSDKEKGMIDNAPALLEKLRQLQSHAANRDTNIKNAEKEKATLRTFEKASSELAEYIKIY